MKWERLELGEAMEVRGPGKRWGHTVNAIRGGKLLYVFGGYGKDNCQTNQVHVFDTDTKTWTNPVVKGTPPSPRDSHTCTTVGDNLFVFGGTDGLNPLQDLHILDTSTNTWVSPSLRGNGPDPREGHGAALIGRRLFIFGGCGKSMNNASEVYYNDLYILDTETLVWQRSTASGSTPAPRDSHTCSSWMNKIIVIGGEDQNDYYLSDVHELDTDTLVWRQLTTSGQLLPPRAGHSTVAIGKHLFVFGGFSDAQNLYDDLYMLDVDNSAWTKITTIGNGPSARFSMAVDCLDPSMGGILVFLGGCNKTLEALGDMYFLHTGLSRENGREERRLEKLSLRKQLKMKCQERNLPASFDDNALVPIEVANVSASTNMTNHSRQSQQYFHLNMYHPPVGKRTFQAKLMTNFPNGYTIETFIDGKPLRGILFPAKTLTDKTTDTNNNGKRDVQLGRDSKLNADCDPESGSSMFSKPQAGTADASVVKDPEVGARDSKPSNAPNLIVENDISNETPASSCLHSPSAAEDR